jgi:hypothetical protein
MVITPYKPHTYFSIKGSLSLLLGSILIGLATGGLAYFVSKYFYLLIVFPIVISFIPIRLFDYLFKSSKTNAKLIMIAAAAAFGVCCSLVFNLIWYNDYQEGFIADVQETYQMTREEAIQAIDDYYVEETGQQGFIAYEILSADLGVDFYNSFTYRSMTLFNFTVSTQGITYWLYNIVETLLFGFGLLWMGLKRCADPFSLCAKDWYDRYVNCIGAIPESSKTLFLSYLNASRLEDAKQLIIPEGDLEHPKIEVYQNLAKNAEGDSLITVKETSLSAGKVKRKIIHQYEVLTQASFYSPNLD